MRKKKKKVPKGYHKCQSQCTQNYYCHVSTMGPNHVLLCIHAQLHDFTQQPTCCFLEIWFYPQNRQQGRKEFIKSIYVYVNEIFK